MPTPRACSAVLMADDTDPVTVCAEQLIGLASSRSLLTRLEELLANCGGLPARLYLADAQTCTFYPAAGLGCEQPSDELDMLATLAGLGPGDLVLRQRDEVIGLLQHAPAIEAGIATALASLLGPVLLATQQAKSQTDELHRLHSQVHHIVTAGQLLRHIDIEVLLVEILQTSLRSVGAEVGALVTADEHGALELRAAWGLREDHLEHLRTRTGRPLAAEVLASGRALRLEGSDLTESLDLAGFDGVLTGLMALPLQAGDRRQGVVLLANPSKAFGLEGQRVAEMVCDMAAIALDNAMLVRSLVERERLSRELDIAREVQLDMFPPGGITVGGISALGAFRPCDETGGDYFTCLERNGRAVVMIGDVTGHGLGAALFTTAAHALVQQQLHSGAGLVETLRTVNEGLHYTGSGRFMTAALVEVDPASGAFEYGSAGHNPLLWIHRGEVRWLDSQGMPLGIMSDYRHDGTGRGELAPGDLLLLYTDGFVESMDATEECFGDERLAATLREGLAQDLDEQGLIDHLFAALERWSGGAKPADDLTVVVLRRA